MYFWHMRHQYFRHSSPGNFQYYRHSCQKWATMVRSWYGGYYLIVKCPELRELINLPRKCTCQVLPKEANHQINLEVTNISTRWLPYCEQIRKKIIVLCLRINFAATCIPNLRLATIYFKPMKKRRKHFSKMSLLFYSDSIYQHCFRNI